MDSGPAHKIKGKVDQLSLNLGKAGNRDPSALAQNVNFYQDALSLPSLLPRRVGLMPSYYSLSPW